mmetsp:Transcript_29312/g.68135  ORF Transcript_29312/g.68135 Transcript_29312/m.68135 type:complete len:302 (+) Transcript_29312:64-969(+)
MAAMRALLYALIADASALVSWTAPHRGEHAGKRFAPHVALFKFQRTGSSFLMDSLEGAACQHWDCRGHWKSEILTEVCDRGRQALCEPAAALQMIRRYVATCGSHTSCGWSLNLLRHENMGLRIWESIVELMSAQPTTAIFLTRENAASQALSYAIGLARTSVMNSAEYFQQFGFPYMCNAFHFSNCNQQQQAWVNKRGPFRLDPKQFRNSVKEYETNTRIYKKFETELRARKPANITILHLTFEDLFRQQTWEELFSVVGLAGHQHIPSMHYQSEYARFVVNWKEVEEVALSMGYNITSL